MIVLVGSWCCCIELLPTESLMLCSFEGATVGRRHCNGAGDILLLVIGAERKIKVAEVAEDVAEEAAEEAAEVHVAEEAAEVIEVIEVSGCESNFYASG